eukprot:2743242-Rhodomonas_salina.4
MEFLKTNFPPPRPSTAAAESAPPSAKKILLSAIRAYHPDKQRRNFKLKLSSSSSPDAVRE